ncbi:MAG: flippase-like domain-containing protein [Bacteroidales bacterium]|nr:flippase-like domain-containing protein [Bacteroidales bacterium]
MNKKRTIHLLLSGLFTALLIAVILYFVSLADLVQALSLVGYKFIIIGFFLHLVTYFIRTILLYFFLGTNSMTFKYLLSIHFIQNFFVHLIPASLGEFSFPILLKDKVKMSASISALLITKISIMVGLLFLFVISIYIIFKDQIHFGIGISSIITLSIIFISLIFIRIHKKNLKNQFLQKINSAFITLKLSVKRDLRKFRDVKFCILFIMLIFVSNLSLAYFYITILKGMGINLNFWQSIFISTLGISFLILPFKSFGGFGTSEGSWAVGMVLIGFDKTIGIQTGFVTHVFALLNVLILLIIGIVLLIHEKRKIELKVNNIKSVYS